VSDGRVVVVNGSFSAENGKSGFRPEGVRHGAYRLVRRLGGTAAQTANDHASHCATRHVGSCLVGDDVGAQTWSSNVRDVAAK
jgi:hypothetical protein